MNNAADPVIVSLESKSDDVDCEIYFRRQV
jgi:hypothetical protein